MSTINLLPDDYLRRQAQMRANILCGALFAAVMAGVAFASLKSQESHNALQARQQKVSDEYSRTYSIIETMYEMEQRKGTMIAKADDTARLMEKMPRSYLLGLVTQLCPKNISLHSFELVTKKITSPDHAAKYEQAMARKSGRAQPYGVEIYLTGYAKSDIDVDVARYLLALENSPAIARADLDSSKDVKDKEMSVREFKFHLYLVHDADAIEMIHPDRADSDNAMSYAPNKAD